MDLKGRVGVRPILTLQYLRAGAAIAVIAFHRLQDLHPIFKVGEHGVDLFFVISGFIMVALTDRREVTPASFILDRVTRIVPLYWVATIAAFTAAYAGIAVYGASADPRLFARSLLFIPSFSPKGQIWPTLYLGWTLNYEAFFYASFAAALLVPRGSRLWAVTFFFSALVIAGRVAEPRAAAALFYTSPLVLEFLAGAIMGRIFGADLRANDQARCVRLCVLLTLAMVALSVLFRSWLMEARPSHLRPRRSSWNGTAGCRISPG